MNLARESHSLKNNPGNKTTTDVDYLHSLKKNIKGESYTEILCTQQRNTASYSKAFYIPTVTG